VWHDFKSKIIRRYTISGTSYRYSYVIPIGKSEGTTWLFTSMSGETISTRRRNNRSRVRRATIPYTPFRGDLAHIIIYRCYIINIYKTRIGIRFGLLFCFRADSLLSRNIAILVVPTVLPTYNQKLPTRPRLFVDFFPDNGVTESYCYNIIYVHFVRTDINKTDKYRIHSNRICCLRRFELAHKLSSCFNWWFFYSKTLIYIFIWKTFFPFDVKNVFQFVYNT